MNNITVKFLARTERPSTIVAYFMIYLTPLPLVPALSVWRTPDLSTLVRLSVLAASERSPTSRSPGHAAADASACSYFEFARLPCRADRFLWFGEVTDLGPAGAAIIAGSAVYVAHRGAAVARTAPPSCRAPSPASRGCRRAGILE
jgi:hypothetical protein